MEFYHKDEFLKQFRSKWLPKYDFPVVLVIENEGLELFIDAQELNTFENAGQLIAAIKKRQFHY